MKHCKCGRILCDFCEKERATIKLQNKYNGNVLYSCKDCYKELFGNVKDDNRIIGERK